MLEQWLAYNTRDDGNNNITRRFSRLAFKRSGSIYILKYIDHIHGGIVFSVWYFSELLRSVNCCSDYKTADSR